MTTHPLFRRCVRSPLSVTILAATVLAGCAASSEPVKNEPAQPAPSATTPASEPAANGPSAVDRREPMPMPSFSRPARALWPLRFMADRWVCVTDNGLVNEEQWMMPRGSTMLGMFRQIRRDSLPAFNEVSQIMVEKGVITLRLRHLHTFLELPEKREELSVFTLKSISDDRVEFTGTGDAADLTSMVYRLSGPDELTIEYTYRPGSKEKSFTLVYKREPSAQARRAE